MSHSSRPLIGPNLLTYARAFAEARADLAAMNYEHQRELDALRQGIAELRAQLDRLHGEIAELRSITADIASELCRKADEDVAALRGKLERALLRLHEHGPITLFN
jgi:phage shock protein A